MPAKNVIKTYVLNGYYHIYNRGVDKRVIFIDTADYSYFLYLLKKYLYPKEQNSHYDPLLNQKSKYSISNKVSLLCYCLMPNHFHLLVKQLNEKSIDELMRKVCTSYSLYFNVKYKRQGTLFQGRYKAVLINNESQLLYITKYIHLNPLKLVKEVYLLQDYLWSSYSSYLGFKNIIWLDKTIILNMFFGKNQTAEYKVFVESSYLFDELVGLEQTPVSSNMLIDMD